MWILSKLIYLCLIWHFMICPRSARMRRLAWYSCASAKLCKTCIPLKETPSKVKYTKKKKFLCGDIGTWTVILYLLLWYFLPQHLVKISHQLCFLYCFHVASRLTKLKRKVLNLSNASCLCSRIYSDWSHQRTNAIVGLSFYYLGRHLALKVKIALFSD